MSNLVMASDRIMADYLITDRVAEDNGYPKLRAQILAASAQKDAQQYDNLAEAIAANKDDCHTIARAAQQDASKYYDLIDSMAACRGDWWQISDMSNQLAEMLFPCTQRKDATVGELADTLANFFLDVNDASFS